MLSVSPVLINVADISTVSPIPNQLFVEYFLFLPEETLNLDHQRWLEQSSTIGRQEIESALALCACTSMAVIT